MLSRWMMSVLVILAACMTAGAAALEFKPTFVSCGYYWSPDGALPDRSAIRVEFRAEGDSQWHEAFGPLPFPQDQQYRGSIVGLQENHAYTLRILNHDGKPLCEGRFRTWASDVPIARTVDIRERLAAGGIVIKDKGTADGWIRFIAPAGTVLDGDQSKAASGAGLDIDGAEYVILEGLTVRGGPRHAISVAGSHFIRILNCDVAGFGETGPMQTDPMLVHFRPGGMEINNDAGIRVVDSVGTVVERCYIHDSRSPSTGWRSTHPVGPNAMFVNRLESTVVRWNDFVGNDDSRWNDVIESGGNFLPDGGFGRDADIYGNYLAFARDDSIELDGGQMNVRLFDNKMEAAYDFVSVNAIVRGPSYIFRNLLVHADDGDTLYGAGFKDLGGGQPHHDGPAVYVNNTMVSNSFGFAGPPNWRFARNNIVVSATSPYGISTRPDCDFDSDLIWSSRGLKTSPELMRARTKEVRPQFMDENAGLFAVRTATAGDGDGARVSNLMEPDAAGKLWRGAIPPGCREPWPPRPSGFAADRGQILFEPTRGGTQTVKVTCRSTTASGLLRIGQSPSVTWLTVEPSSAEIAPGKSIEFQVTLHPERLAYVGSHSTAFLIRSQDGLSAPISVYAWKTGDKEDEIAFREGTVFLDATAPERGRPLIIENSDAEKGRAVQLDPEKCETLSWSFEVAREGDYFILAHVFAGFPRPEYNKIAVGVDGAEPTSIMLSVAPDRWLWCGFRNDARPARRKWLHSQFGLWHLTAGAHTLRIKPIKPLLIDRIAITPWFELKSGHVNNFSDVPVQMPERAKRN